MTSPRKPIRFIVRDPRQVQALSGPLPQRLISAFERLGRCTVADLADAIDEPVASLYYHVRKFERVGLIRAAGTRGEGQRAEAVYEFPGRELVFDHANESEVYVTALGKAVGSLARIAERAYRAALGHRQSRRTGRLRNHMLQQHYARLSNADLAELNRRLEDIATFIRERDHPDATRWITLTMLMAPLLRKADRQG